MTSNIECRQLREGDLAGADRLRAAAGWNQRLVDWRRFLALAPEGCFVAEQEGRIVGTATTTSYGRDLAWIGMVLVDPESRKQGIGRQLLMTCLDYLRGQKIACIKLDATPAGQIVYEKLGFKVEWPLARWMRQEASPQAAQNFGAPLTKDDWLEVEGLDRDVFGADRGELLHRLAKDSAQSVVLRATDGSLSAFGFLRGGINADYVGPVVAREVAAGEAAVRQLLSLTGRQVFWDIPERCPEAVALAKELGFTIQRPLTRMYLGTNDSPGEPQKVWAISDPATG